MVASHGSDEGTPPDEQFTQTPQSSHAQWNIWLDDRIYRKVRWFVISRS
jgi:hypothetical protein